MKVRIIPGKASGRIKAPASKSMAHRLLISAAMAEGVSRISGVSDCDDVRATVACLSALGIRIEFEGDTAVVHGKSPTEYKPTGTLSAAESGSTLRFMIPIALISGNTVMFSGKSGLMSRPMSVYDDICHERHLNFIQDGNTITVRGPISSGTYTVVGNISSQFISGLLFALPNLSGNSKIKLIPPVESRSYINMTISALESFGINIIWEDDYTLLIPGGQRFKPGDLAVEGDFSGSAFIDALSLFGGDVSVDGLVEDSLQGDKIYRKMFPKLALGTPTLHIEDSPDLGPILFAVAAAKHGGIFEGTRRLKIKESDRALAMAEELRKFGTHLSVYEDKVVVYPADFHAPTAPLSGHNDHRIVMALAILLTVVGGEIDGAEAINKSYPAFFTHLRELGITVIEYED